MSGNVGTTVIAPIRPHDTSDTFPTAHADEILGGVHAVANAAARLAISNDRRVFGMIAYEKDTKNFYILEDSGDHDVTNNANWGTAITAANIRSAISASHTQNTDTGTNSNTFTLDDGAHTGKIIVDVANGVADKSLTITNEALDGDRIATFPNKTGTVAMTSDLPLLEEDIIPIEFCADGAVAPDAAEDYTNTNAKIRVRKFGFAADQDVIFQWPVPKYIDTTVKPQFLVEYIISEATAPAENEVVAFSLSGYSVGDGDNTTAAFGAAVTSSRTHPAGDAQHDRYTTAQSGDITVTNLAAGELAFFNLIRLATTTDTYSQKVAVTNIKIFWKRL